MRFKRFGIILPALLLACVCMFSCNRSLRSFFHEGVSLELAQYRARHIYDVHYELRFQIPADKTEPVQGRAGIRFKLLKARHGVIIDFQPGEEFIQEVWVNGQPGNYSWMNGHIYLDANGLVPRQDNLVEIVFMSSDQALNRSEDFMYTLFVPDRASTAFPCFDQPDIKATFDLQLTLPAHWTAMSNGPLMADSLSEENRIMQFRSSRPISTYLMAFTAGVFEQLQEERDGRVLNIFHRETDKEKVQRNMPRIFDQHFHALAWMEEYTGIAYPYEKFDMAILPGFQYSGMEHPGAVWYRDGRLLLDEDPGTTRLLSKASLIAHETAHMWFGNLVTMKWFDDVWLKEVFAGFMADKIVAEQFPDVNHSLQFMLHHFPRAMSVDRSRGSHPIKQELSNMKMAGTLYGPIIYNKAPIVFAQLEKIMHESAFRAAVQEYLQTFSHGNADWSDLVTVFSKYSKHNIKGWSNAWIYGKGMPEYTYRLTGKQDGEMELQISQPQPPSKTNIFTQYLKGIVLADTMVESFEVFADQIEIYHYLPVSQKPSLVLLNGGGMGYGLINLQEEDVEFAIKQYPDLIDENIRAALVLSMYENFLHGNIETSRYSDFVLNALENESNQQIVNYLLSNLDALCFNFSDLNNDSELAGRVEEVLWNRMQYTDDIPVDVFLRSLMMHARSRQATNRLLSIYEGHVKPKGFAMGEEVRSALALELALRLPSDSKILELELEKISNPDRNRKLRFIMPAVSPEKSVRDAFFNNLLLAENRNPEPWVLEALYYLHHPLHQGQSIDYIPACLELLEEIQRTGDIFFPQNWLTAILGNYHQPEVMEMVNHYLESNSNLSENLRQKVYQASDRLYRATL